MRRVVRCRSCALCAYYRPAGFTAREELACTRTGWRVEPDDGCTFGEAGDPQQGAVPYDVCLGLQMRTQREWDSW